MIPLGTMNVPAGWRATTEIILTEETKARAKMPLHPGAEKSQAPATLRLNRESVELRSFSLERALNNTLGELADGMKSFELVEQKPIEFEDGTKGFLARVRYEVMPGALVLQCHAVRLDGPVLTRFTGSVDAKASDRMESLEKMIRSFKAL